MELPAKVAEFRARHRGQHIGPRYNGWLHFATTTFGAATVISFCAWQVDTPSLLELAMIPVFFLFANLVEYFGHKGPMHHRSKALGILFERHSQQHHRFFTHDVMEVESARDFQMVLFPPMMLGVFLGGVAPVGLLLAVLTTANIGYLFVATGFSYFLLYEWMHWAYHQPLASRIGGSRLIARLRRHHLLHHDQEQMTSVNFNITFPIGDWLFGTSAQKTTQSAHPVRLS
ncbi:MAG TPA: sterol desaturase family protein [Kofleriaceae bacterium]